jgi:RND family efflux transporter MFP subunit
VSPFPEVWQGHEAWSSIPGHRGKGHVIKKKADLEALRIDRDAADRPGRSRWIWIVLLIVVVVAAAAGAFVLFGPEPVPTVQTAAVRESADGAAGQVLNASGYVTARNRATVSSKITGKLVEVHVEEGLAVTEGQLLARLDDSQYRASLALAESRLDAARGSLEETRVQIELADLTLSRTQRLVNEGVAGQADLDAARTEAEALRARLALEQQQVAVAEREVALRRVELADTVIRAPFDGIVISKDAQTGEMVSPVSAGGGFTRTGICTIVDMGSLEIEVDVNESYISRVRPGQPTEAVLDAYPDWRIPSRVITTIPAADRQKATVLVRIGFDELDPRILPDMGVKVAFLDMEIAGAAAAENRRRILAPRAAVRTVDGREIVFVVSRDRVERRAVQVGAAQGTEIEILSGLSAGERVVVGDPGDLSDGDEVREERS